MKKSNRKNNLILIGSVLYIFLAAIYQKKLTNLYWIFVVVLPLSYCLTFKLAGRKYKKEIEKIRSEKDEQILALTEEKKVSQNPIVVLTHNIENWVKNNYPTCHWKYTNLNVGKDVADKESRIVLNDEIDVVLTLSEELEIISSSEVMRPYAITKRKIKSISNDIQAWVNAYYPGFVWEYNGLDFPFKVLKATTIPLTLKKGKVALTADIELSDDKDRVILSLTPREEIVEPAKETVKETTKVTTPVTTEARFFQDKHSLLMELIKEAMDNGDDVVIIPLAELKGYEDEKDLIVEQLVTIKGFESSVITDEGIRCGIPF